MIEAKFIYEFDGKIEDLFVDKEVCEITLSRLEYPINTANCLKAILPPSKLKLFDKKNPIKFKLESLQDVFPIKLVTYSPTQNVKFKIESELIQIISLIDNKISFVDHNSLVSTFELLDGYRIVKT